MKNLLLIVFAMTVLLTEGYSQGAADSIYLEAESGLVEAPMQVFEDIEASGGLFVMVEPGNISADAPPSVGMISIEVNLNAGTYKIWGRVITPSGSEDSFWVQVNDGTAYRWNAIGEYTSWTWAPVHDSDNNARQVEWALDEGNHTIDIFYREEGARIDEVYITRFDDTPTKGNKVVSRTIHVSQELGDDSSDGSMENPIRTLFKAYEIAQNTKDEVTDYQILLRGGETYDDFEPIYGLEEGRGPVYFGFVWDINRKLTISTYGSDEKAHLLGSKHKHEGGPTQGLLIINPSAEDVLIENLFFEMWQEGAIMTFETEDVHIRNIRINKIGTYYFPAEETARESELYPYTAGVVYPKNSTRILMEYIEMTNCHNIFEDVTNLHGFYGTRLNESEIRNCYLRNVSGSPFKFRRSQANNVYVHDNEAYYTGHTEFEDSWAQPGFLRYSGDPGGNCPFALTFENNLFHYPFCWSEYGEVSETAETILCSVSNTTSCGENACTDPDRVNWLNNDIIFGWVEGQQTELPTAPFGLQGFSETENAVTIEWFDINVNETSFIIERKIEGQFQEVARLDPNTTQFTDTGLEASTSYEYRISVENKVGISPNSEPIEIKTQAPNQEPVPIINVSKTEGYPPLEVHFESKESFDPDEDELFHTWYVDDIFISNQDSITYTFTDPGIYTVTLKLDDGQNESETSVEINVSEILASNNGAEVLIYPSPSDGYFYISSHQSSIEVSIFNMTGKRVLEMSQNKNERITYHLASGVYTICIVSKDGQTFKRLIIK